MKVRYPVDIIFDDKSRGRFVVSFEEAGGATVDNFRTGAWHYTRSKPIRPNITTARALAEMTWKNHGSDPHA